MVGNILNFVAILVGSGLGMVLGNRLPVRVKSTLTSVLGLFVSVLGVQMFLETSNAMIVLGALVIGTLLGEWWRIEEGFHNLGAWLEKKFNRGESSGEQDRFIRGFLAASLIYCVGPIAILGSIQDGLTGNYLMLAVKSVLDGVMSITLASTFGIGVAFSALPVLLYQGVISLLANQVQAVTSEAMMLEMTATGGVVLLGIGISSILEIKKIRTANLIPALFVAPLLVAALTALHIQY